MTDTSYKAIRDQQGLTQVEFSVKHDVSLSVVQAFETKVQRIASFSARTRRKLARAYGVNVQDIDAICDADVRQPQHSS